MSELANLSESDRWAYVLSLKDKRDYYSVQRTIEEESLKKGIGQGIGQGIKQGDEKRVNRVIANMLKAGKFTLEDIAVAVEKDINYVKTIKTKLENDDT